MYVPPWDAGVLTDPSIWKRYPEAHDCSIWVGDLSAGDPFDDFHWESCGVGCERATALPINIPPGTEAAGNMAWVDPRMTVIGDVGGRVIAAYAIGASSLGYTRVFADPWTGTTLSAYQARNSRKCAGLPGNRAAPTWDFVYQTEGAHEMAVIENDPLAGYFRLQWVPLPDVIQSAMTGWRGAYAFGFGGAVAFGSATTPQFDLVTMSGRGLVGHNGLTLSRASGGARDTLSAWTKARGPFQMFSDPQFHVRGVGMSDEWLVWTTGTTSSAATYLTDQPRVYFAPFTDDPTKLSADFVDLGGPLSLFQAYTGGHYAVAHGCSTDAPTQPEQRCALHVVDLSTKQVRRVWDAAPTGPYINRYVLALDDQYLLVGYTGGWDPVAISEWRRYRLDQLDAIEAATAPDGGPVGDAGTD